MKLLVGLGNPGSEYAKTRHNVGFMVLDRLIDRLDLAWRGHNRSVSQVAELNVHNQKIIAVKPETFMNLSGEAVRNLAEYYQIEPEDIWVVYDELDLPLGTIRVRQNGSSGGHNGIKSIIEHLKSDNFYHIRVGIGPALGPDGQAEQPRRDAAAYVLEAFMQTELPMLEKAVDKTIELVLNSLETGELDSHTIQIDGIS